MIGLYRMCVCGIEERDCMRQQQREESCECCDERLAARYAELGITLCSVCGEPAHASETDDHDRCEACRPPVKIKMTSTRSGRVGWIRPDGTPSDYEGDAGRFDVVAANAVIEEYTATLVRVVGRCANTFTLVEVQP